MLGPSARLPLRELSCRQSSMSCWIRARIESRRSTGGSRSSASAVQRTEVHHDALGSELSVRVETVERDERELDVALRRRKAEELTRVFPAHATFDHGLRVGEVLFVNRGPQAGERAGGGTHSYVAMRPTDGLVAREGLAVVDHHAVLRERGHDPLQIVVVLGGIVRVHERSSPFAFSVVDGHGHSFGLVLWSFSKQRRAASIAPFAMFWSRRRSWPARPSTRIATDDANSIAASGSRSRSVPASACASCRCARRSACIAFSPS